MSNFRVWIQLLKPHKNDRKVTVWAIVAFLFTVISKIIHHFVDDDESISQSLRLTKIFIGEQCRTDNPMFFPEMLDTKLRNIIAYQTYYIVVSQFFTILLAAIISTCVLRIIEGKKKTLHLKTFLKHFVISFIYIYAAYSFLPYDFSTKAWIIFLIIPLLTGYIFIRVLINNYSKWKIVLISTVAALVGILASVSLYNLYSPRLYRKTLLPAFVKHVCGKNTSILAASIIDVEDKITAPHIKSKIERFNKLYQNENVQRYINEKDQFDTKFHFKLESYLNYMKQLEEINLKSYRVVLDNKPFFEENKKIAAMGTDDAVREYYSQNPIALKRAEKFQNEFIAFLKENNFAEKYKILKKQYFEYQSDNEFKKNLENYVKFAKNTREDEVLMQDLAELETLKNEITNSLKISVDNLPSKPVDLDQKIKLMIEKPLF